MNWKYVLRTDKIDNFYDAIKTSRKIGYEFVLWNGEVWFVEKNNHHKTNLTIDDLF